jgi:hypothetical protein
MVRQTLKQQKPVAAWDKLQASILLSTEITGQTLIMGDYPRTYNSKAISINCVGYCVFLSIKS